MIIETNDPTAPQLKVTCTGMVRGAFKDAPAALNFGLIDPESLGVSQTLALVRGDGGPIAPKVLPPQTPGLSAELKEVRAGEHYELTVKLSPPLAMGQLGGVLMVETGVPNAPSEGFRVLGNVVRRVQVAPAELRLPACAEAETERSVRVLWHNSLPHKILTATCNDPKLEARVVIAGISQEVFLKAPAGYEAPSPPPTVTVKTDDPTRAELVIPVRLEEAKPAANKMSP